MGILWEEDSFWVFVILTVILGGGAAYLTGRAMALTWRPLTIVIFYMAVLASAVRFFHFALFGGTLLTIHYWIVDFIVLLIFAGLGFRITRAGQMSTQYRWVYARSGPFSWRTRPPAETETVDPK
jgi:Domain of unknown function (DUF6867)